jgi:hypothetical protein
MDNECYLKNIKEEIKKAINEFIFKEFTPNAYNYLNESDIQAHLFFILRQRVNGLTNNKIEITNY